MIICRVCLDNDEKLIPLVSDNIDAWPLVYMLNQFTIINMEEKIPKYICETCAGHLDVAFSFKRKYEDSIIRFVRQISGEEESELTAASNSSMTNEACFQTEEDDSKPHETMQSDSPAGVKGSTVDEGIDVKVVPKVISLDNNVERLHSDDSSNERQHVLVGSIVCDNDGNLIQNYQMNIKSVVRSDSLTSNEVLDKTYHYGYGMKSFKCDVCCTWHKTSKDRIKCRKCSLTFLTKPHFRTHRCFANLK